MLRAVVIAYLAVYVSVSLFHRPWKRSVRRFAVVIVVWSGAWRRLGLGSEMFSMLGVGALVGALAFVFGVVLSRIGTGGVLAGLRSAAGLGSFIAANRKITARCILAAGAEELLWRCGIQAVLGNTPTAVVVTALCFSLIHVVRDKDVVVLAPYFDLLVFSFVLGVLYHTWPNFLVVFAAHAVRNLGVRGLIHARRDQVDPLSSS